MLAASVPGPGPDLGFGALVPRKPLFVPRDMLSVPEFFGVHEHVDWNLAHSPLDAVHLARAREQHELAHTMWVERTQNANSILDIAVALDTTFNTLQPKLKGRVPASEDDMIRWAWLVGKERPSYKPRDLWAGPFPMPRFPLPGSKLL